MAGARGHHVPPAPFVGYAQNLSMSTGANPPHPDYRKCAAAI